ncbi:hypothetical protein A2U01_0089379, partial [Trifolium medium]|nr:hypothetical protein [Trifolium medium]
TNPLLGQSMSVETFSGTLLLLPLQWYQVNPQSHRTSQDGYTDPHVVNLQKD